MSALPLVLLAPSEDKAPGGEAGRLAETPAQAWVRKGLVALARTASPADLARALGVKGLALDRARSEALALGGAAPLRPALERYTGVAFQALDAPSLPPDTWRRLWVVSLLRGLVRGDAPVPAYKLSLGSLPGLRPHWRKHLPADLAGLPEGPLWELLPADFAALLAGWDRPRHTLDIRDARGRAVSHWSKHYRGLVARWILAHGTGDPRRVLRGRLPGCQWGGVADNDRGGLVLTLVVDP